MYQERPQWPLQSTFVTGSQLLVAQRKLVCANGANEDSPASWSLPASFVITSRLLTKHLQAKELWAPRYTTHASEPHFHQDQTFVFTQQLAIVTTPPCNIPRLDHSLPTSSHCNLSSVDTPVFDTLASCPAPASISSTTSHSTQYHNGTIRSRASAGNGL